VLPVAGVTRNEAAKYKSNPEQTCTNKECCSSCDCNLLLYSQSFEPCNPTSKRSQDSHIGASRRITRTRLCTRWIEYVSGNAPYLAVLVAACYSWTMTRLWCFSRSQYTVLSIVFSIKMLHRSTPLSNCRRFITTSASKQTIYVFPYLCLTSCTVYRGPLHFIWFCWFFCHLSFFALLHLLISHGHCYHHDHLIP
jgi:hypothetical protein